MPLPTSLNDLVALVDFSTVAIIVLSVFAAGISLMLTIKGGQAVYSKVRGGTGPNSRPVCPTCGR
jgi:hypothetical protein